MPTTPGCQPSPDTSRKGLVGLCGCHRNGFFEDELFNRLALAIVQVELLGELHSLVAVARRQQVHP